MFNNSNQKQNLMVFITGFMLKIWLPFILLELIIIFFGGLAYFLLLFWLFYFYLTGVALFPREVKRLAKIALGSKLFEINKDRIRIQRLPTWYWAYWLISNIALLAVVVISFRYNIRLIDVF